MKRRSSRGRPAWKRAAGILARMIGALGALGFVAALVSLAIWPPINDVTTGETPQYPDIQPIAYRMSQPRVLAAAAESVQQLDRFDLVSLDEETGVVEATATTRSGRFVDDITVTVQANGEGGAIVFLRSRSRVGRGDFGQNARNIRALQESMDANLGGT